MADQPPNFTITLIQWCDAAQAYGSEEELVLKDISPILLYACGFILKEDRSSITVGLEEVEDVGSADTARMWVCIPKRAIVARTDYELGPPEKIGRRKK